MRTPLRLTAVLALALAAPAAAQPGGSTHPGQRVIDFSTSDTRMNAAIARARATVGELLARLERADTTDHVIVKLRVAEGDVAEHMWLSDVRYKGGMIHGVLNNVPRDLTRVKLGDPLRVAPGEISDWMVIDGEGRVCGGFTFRVSMSQLTPRQREAVYQQQGILRMPAGDEQVCAADDEAGNAH